MWFSTALFSQNESFEEYRNRKQRDFRQYKQDRQSEFEQYRARLNKEFAEYLARKWQEVKVYKGIVPPPMPDPFVPRPEEEREESPVAPPRNLPIGDIVPPRPVLPSVPPLRIDKPKEEEAVGKLLGVNFCGAFYKIRSSGKCRIALSSTQPSAISSAWTQMASKELDPLVYDCQRVREECRLCDWAYYLFVRQVAAEFMGQGKGNEAVLLTGYVLAQSGMDFRFARSEQRLLMALPFDITVYRYYYIDIDGRKYYLINDEEAETAEIVARSFSDQSGVCSLRISEEMKLPRKSSEVRVLASKKYPSLRLSLTLNESLMEFYGRYPRIDWNVYALTPMEEETAEQLLPMFRKALAGKGEEEAVDMILNFVQTAFTYGYDDKIWGYDRPFFPDETLYYPYSDCEDRAILFSQLVRRLTGLDVVLLHYPNHLATAVRFKRDLAGDYVMVDGHKYLVCDPTGYKPIGNAYDQFKNVKAEVIKLNQ